jgi:hypothetical protein
VFLRRFFNGANPREAGSILIPGPFSSATTLEVFLCQRPHPLLKHRRRDPPARLMKRIQQHPDVPEDCFIKKTTSNEHDSGS